MRVLFITPYLPNHLRTRPFNLLKQLTERHEIALLSPVFNAQERREAQQLQQTLPNLKVTTVFCSKLQSLTRSLRAGFDHLPMQAHYCYSPAMIKTAQDLLRTDHYDLIHIEHFRAAYLGRELVFSGVPIVYDAVDSISLLVERTLQHGPLKQRLISWLELAATRRYEGDLISAGYFEQVCATSREDAAALEQLAGLKAGGEQVKIIPNGVNTAEFSPPLPGTRREPATAIFTGKMSYHSNAAAARYLIKQIWPRVRLDRPDAKLWIVGSRPPKDVLAHSGRNGIEVTGYVPDLARYLNRATLAVAPLVYSVGIQNKVLEALACATPTVASAQVSRSINVKSDRDLYLVPTGQPEAFAQQMVELFENPVRAAAIGQSGRDFVLREHTWPEASRQLEELWTAVRPNPTALARLVS